MIFHRNDMKGAHYSWDEEVKKEENLFSREPSRKLFDRFNGEQVLFLINYYGSIASDFTILKARKIEWEIENHLPADIRSEKSVFNWIIETASRSQGF